MLAQFRFSMKNIFCSGFVSALMFSEFCRLDSGLNWFIERFGL